MLATTTYSQEHLYKHPHTDIELKQILVVLDLLKDAVESVLQVHSVQAYIPIVETRPLECC